MLAVLGLGSRSTDVTHALQVRLLCDGYELDDQSEVIDAILWWQDRCQRGIEDGAARGDPAMMRLRLGRASSYS